ncbi:puff-specific protein Bx42 [Brevipalpus obovatus]|uniref:puff-specific protein Bx42 n=1 Tax=Brevipalpus obovatus TaxID=246614 RepID=UPI003D9EF12A
MSTAVSRLPNVSSVRMSSSSPSPSASSNTTVNTLVPSYGQRKGWIPRSLQDFCDGGAYPEISVPQYPLNMGKKETKSLVKVDTKHYLPPELAPEILDEEELKKPSEEEIKEVAERTAAALELLTKTKISAAMPVRAAESQAPAQYIRYKSEQGDGNQRLIRMIEVQKDPLEPPKFKINKKIPQGPPSPPAPVIHSPPRRVSVKEQKDWKIPPCISNWKNRGGYVLPLDKRLAADGRGIQQAHVNENFAKLTEALYIAERKAREGVEMRSEMERKQLQKEKEKKEANLKKLAQKAREERAGYKGSSENRKVDEDVRERDDIRHEKHKERQRERNIQRAAPEKRSKLEKQRERDISEQIALGLANPRANSNEIQFDTRLLNQNKGLGTGFGEEDDYAVYDKPWRSNAELNKSIYRPRNTQNDVTDELEKIATTSKFTPDKGFEGMAPRGERDGPVTFEKAPKEKEEEDDPFGIADFLKEAKKSSKRKESNHEHRGSYKKKKDH